MISYNKKCKGCGAVLNDDKNSIGYVPKFDETKTIYCQRCFRLINYNENNVNENVHNNIVNTINNLELKDKHVFLVVDVLDIKYSLIKFKEHPKNLTILINKMDLLPSDSNYQKIQKNIINIINSYNYDYSNIMFVSAKSKTSIKLLFSEIKKISNNKKKVIFVGKSNVGKSSIINALLKLNDQKPTLTTNNSINTTINLQQVKIGRINIIDTPGFVSDDNCLYYLNHQDISKIFNDKTIKPKIFQIPYNKDLLIENLASIQVEPNQKGTIIFYGANLLKLKTFKAKDKQILNQNTNISYKRSLKPTLKIVEFENNELNRLNISISGIGMLVFIGIKKIKILVHKNIEVSIIYKPLL